MPGDKWKGTTWPRYLASSRRSSSCRVSFILFSCLHSLYACFVSMAMFQLVRYVQGLLTMMMMMNDGPLHVDIVDEVICANVAWQRGIVE